MIFDATVDGRTLRVEVRESEGRYALVLDGREVVVDASVAGPHLVSLLLRGESHEVGIERRPGGYTVHLPGETLAVDLAPAARGAAAPLPRAHGPSRVVAPMPGRVARVLVAPGADVAAGQGLVVVEAMKMENEVRAPRAGRVLEVAVHEGLAVDAGALLAVVG